MTRLKYRGLATIGMLALSMLVTGCSTDFPDTPTETPPVILTEPLFTGTIGINGAATQPFVATAAGTVQVTINALADSNGSAALGPSGTIRVGMALGTWNGTICQAVLTNDNSFVATVITAAVTASGNLCARIYDSGKITEPVTFELLITHP